MPRAERRLARTMKQSQCPSGFNLDLALRRVHPLVPMHVICNLIISELWQHLLIFVVIRGRSRQSLSEETLVGLFDLLRSAALDAG